MYRLAALIGFALLILGAAEAAEPGDVRPTGFACLTPAPFAADLEAREKGETSDAFDAAIEEGHCMAGPAIPVGLVERVIGPVTIAGYVYEVWRVVSPTGREMFAGFRDAAQ